MTTYVVDVKPSARRTNGAVGATVNRGGTRRTFPSREDAESWALGLSERGDRRVWIRTANPNDRTGADAYLIGRRVRHDAERRDGPGDGEQATLTADDGATGRR